jgi:hypothetical protein
MNSNNYECAKIINYQFKRLRQTYTKTVNYLDGINHTIISQQEIDHWLNGESSNSPVLLLNTYYYSWDNAELKFVDRKLEREIEYNLLQADKGYFEYIDNTFSKHWSFIKEFKASITTFINNDDKATRCINRLYEPPEKFNKENLKNSIELQLIFIFDIWEGLYKKYDKAYNRYFKESEFSHKYKTNPNCISLDYGDNNDQAINMIFNALSGLKVIECKFEEFTAHFDPFATPPADKIVWLGSNVQLMALLQGKHLRIETNTQSIEYILKLQNKISFDKLMQHFKPLVGDYSLGSLKVGSSRMNKTDKVYGFKYLMLLVDELNHLIK